MPRGERYDTSRAELLRLASAAGPTTAPSADVSVDAPAQGVGCPDTAAAPTPTPTPTPAAVATRASPRGGRGYQVSREVLLLLQRGGGGGGRAGRGGFAATPQQRRGPQQPPQQQPLRRHPSGGTGDQDGALLTPAAPPPPPPRRGQQHQPHQAHQAHQHLHLHRPVATPGSPTTPLGRQQHHPAGHRLLSPRGDQRRVVGAEKGYLCEAALGGTLLPISLRPTAGGGGGGGGAAAGLGVAQPTPVRGGAPSPPPLRVLEQSTCRCSTITQDMELDSQSERTTEGSSLESDTESTPAANLEGSVSLRGARREPQQRRDSSVLLGAYTPPSPLGLGVAGAEEESAVAGISAAPPPAPAPASAVAECAIGDIGLHCRVVHRIGEPEGMGPHAGKITSLRYCLGALSLLAAGTESGIVFIIREGKADSPLNGHTAKVLDLVWSEPGQCLLSLSFDKTIRVWKVGPSRPDANACIRVIREPSVGLCISLAPANNNIFVVGTAGSSLTFYNISTGKQVRRHKLKRAAGYLTWSPNGKALYIGDAGGRVVACEYSFMTNTLKKASVIQLEETCPVTSLSHMRAPDGDDLLLANVMGSAVYLLLGMPGMPYAMSVLRRIAIPQKASVIRSVFLPSQPARKVLFTTGSEDGSLWVVQDPRSEAAPQVLKLQGHQGAVLNVSVNQRGNIASGDEMGCVMVWVCRRRAAGGGGGAPASSLDGGSSESDSASEGGVCNSIGGSSGGGYAEGGGGGGGAGRTVGRRRRGSQALTGDSSDSAEAAVGADGMSTITSDP